MNAAGTSIPGTRASKAVRLRAAVTLPLAFALLLLTNAALAQQGPLAPMESGRIGLAGMLAGLLLFALVALYNHHRRQRADGAHTDRLEATVEARDDRIWLLEEQLARANELIDAQGDLVLREDRNGFVTHANTAVAVVLGTNVDELVGREPRFEVRRESQRSLLADGSVAFDQEILAPDGPRWIAWKESSARDESGRLVERIRVGRDVTARVAAERALADAREKAEAASRAKSRFLAIVSHEVRTPLNGILGMTDLLLETPLTPEQQTYARAVKTSGDALLALIEEVLDFSKIEAGRLDLESVPFDLPVLVTDVAELIAPRAHGKGIEVAVDIGDDVPQRVMGDAARLRQVLLNLAGNAVKFTDAGGVAISVARAGDAAVAFEVIDTGPGIEAEARARIFREFEQGDTTLARRHGGTGLGLAIAARIVERMGGGITLDSPTGEASGSRFRFTIELPGVDARAREPMPDLTGSNILVASPSPVVGPLLARRLSAWGANVSLAADASLALTLLPERAWSHLFADRALGAGASMNLARVAANFVEARHVLLAPSERGELDDLKSAGFGGYLVKPVRAASLAARLSAPGDAPPLVPDFERTDAESKPSGRPLMVLVAEDNDINALLVQALLAKLGHIATVVADGSSAVEAVRTAHVMGAPYDLVLMDLHLPGMDGLDAARRLRASGEGASLPILALTANAFPEDRDACRAAGMDAFLVKPLDRQRLEAAMAEALAARGTAYGHAA